MFISYQKARSLLGETYPYIKRNTKKAEVRVKGDWYYLGFIKYPQGWWLEPYKR
jgi:hypothetical protein